jgi:YD repeat-containing protein
LCLISSGHSCTSTTDTGLGEYTYDDNSNRSRVNEDNGPTSVDRHYCYDARQQLLTVRSSSGCSSGLLETFAYDDAGNRTAAPSRTFGYSADGQLTSCTSPSCTVTHDTDGRMTGFSETGGDVWTYEYDAEGRMTKACKASSCSGTPARVEFTYDAEGHRTSIVEARRGESLWVCREQSG